MSTISTIPSCSGHGLKGPELKACHQTHAMMRKAIAHPYHSARFRDCAGLFSERVSDSSGPQKRSAAAENILNNEFQRDKCNPYSGLFSMDYGVHYTTGKWLEGYVDYGVNNGLNEPAKPDPTDALFHTVHPHVYKTSHSLLDEVHFSLLGYTFGPVVSWAVIIGGVLVVYWYFHR